MIFNISSSGVGSVSLSKLEIKVINWTKVAKIVKQNIT